MKHDLGNAELEYSRQLDQDEFYFMANLFPGTTGLPFTVWISERGGARHDIRVKVSRGAKVIPGELVSVAIRPTVHPIAGTMSRSDLDLLRTWVELNRQVLEDYWEGAIDTAVAMQRLRKV